MYTYIVKLKPGITLDCALIGEESAEKFEGDKNIYLLHLKGQTFSTTLRNPATDIVEWEEVLLTDLDNIFLCAEGGLPVRLPNGAYVIFYWTDNS